MAKLELIARSGLFSLGSAISTLLIAPIVIAPVPLAFERRYALAKLWSRFNIWWLRKTCKISYRISGEHYLPTHPVIVLAKHQSSWETLFLHQYLPPIAWVVKRELLWIPFFGWGLAALKPIAIDRNSKTAIHQVLEQGKARLDDGQWVLLFPEGTRTAPGQRKRYHTGGAQLAARSNYPVLPIAHNAGLFWPRRSFIKYPGTVQVVIGPLIESAGRTANEINRQVETWIETTMDRISVRQVSAGIVE